MNETPQTTLTAITLRVGKMSAYKTVGDKIEQLLPEAKAGTISAAQVLIELVEYLQEQMKGINND